MSVFQPSEINLSGKIVSFMPRGTFNQGVWHFVFYSNICRSLSSRSISNRVCRRKYVRLSRFHFLYHFKNLAKFLIENFKAMVRMMKTSRMKKLIKIGSMQSQKMKCLVCRVTMMTILKPGLPFLYEFLGQVRTLWISYTTGKFSVAFTIVSIQKFIKILQYAMYSRLSGGKDKIQSKIHPIMLN